MIWPFTRRKPADVAKLERRIEAAEVRAEAADKIARIARLEVAEARNNAREWQEYVKSLNVLVMSLAREVDWLRADDTSCVTNAALDRRLTQIELWLLPPVSDGAVELNEASERALERALDNMGKGVVS